MIASQRSWFKKNRLLRSEMTQGDKIEVLCSCDEPYLPHTATMLRSLLEHNAVSRIHLFHISIASEELAKLASLTARYGSELTCYAMVPEDLKDFLLHKSYWSVANYFRLLASRVLPEDIEKVLYLDSDIIVRKSLTELWRTDLHGYACAAIEDAFWDAKLDYAKVPQGCRYFNSGVLLINLGYWRQNNVYERAVEFIKNNPDQLNYYDQDVLNAIFVGQWINLPAVWNDMARSTLHFPAMRNINIPDPAIVHFVGPYKPWNWLCKHPFKYEYRKFRRKTPWPRYREENKPPRYRLLRSVVRRVLPSSLRRWLRSVARRVLPGSLRQWLRSHILSSQA